MPNCVVIGCKNHSSKNKKQDGITFHTFPIRNDHIKEKWIKVIRVSRNEPSWNPSLRSVVCSIHFENDDLYYTKKGLRRVLRNGYPKHLHAASDQSANIDQNKLTTIDAAEPAKPVLELNLYSTSNDHIPATPIEFINVDTKQSQTPIEFINEDTKQSHTSIEFINGDTKQSHTRIEFIDEDTKHSHTRIEFIDEYTKQSHTSQAISDVSEAPVLLTTPILNTEEEIESIFDTPIRHKLRKRIFRLEKQQKQMQKKIKILNQKVRRLKKRNNSLMEILNKVADHATSRKKL